MAARSKYKWQKLPPMPTRRVYSTVIEADGLLFVIGGCDARGDALDVFECYIPKKKKWMRLLNIPTKRAAPAVVAIEKQIVVIGGLGGANDPTDAVEVYDIGKKCWITDKKNMGEELQGVTAVVHRNKPLVVGGMRRDSNPTEKCSVLDLEENCWKELPDILTPRYAASVHLNGDKIYVLGGRQGKLPCASLEMMDLSVKPSPSWTTLKDIPVAGVFPAFVMTDSKFYVLGGLKKKVIEGFHDEFQEYDVEKDEWNQLTVLPRGRSDFGAGMIDGKIIIVGGITSMKTPLTDVAVYEPEEKKWVNQVDIPTARGSGSSYTYQGKLMIVGGFTVSGLSNAVEMVGPS
ncbi:kelch domain-containing protein 8A-like isoform X2 [Apostichopus japonicus]